MAEHLLEGHVVDDAHAQVISLQAENRDLRRQLAIAEREAGQARREASRALSALRQQLSPLYRALQAVFGELDAAGVDEGAAASSPGSVEPNARVMAVWASWKSKLGEGPGKIIDALLVHGDMNTQQVAIATGYHRTSIPKMIYQLNKAGLLNKNGGRFSLKPL